MKKLFTLIMLLISMATANAKCDWSKVYLAYGNSCNVYKFEVAGTVDTCYQTRTIVTNRKTLKKDTFYSRNFGITFSDTGKYNVFVKVYNKCLGCDTGFEKLIYVTCKPTAKRCDWSKLGFGYGNSCNVYKFELGSIDTCLSYTTYIYNYKTGRVIDTFYTRTFSKVFEDTGKYKVYVLTKNKCGGCDTAFYRILWVTCKPTTKCNWSKIGIYYSNRCDTVTFEMGSYIDTCVQYLSYAYQQKTKTWFELSNRRVFRKGLDTGSYIIKAKFYNKCLGCDTTIYREIYIGCDSSKLEIQSVEKPVLKIYPNPSYDYIEIEYSGPHESLQIYDESGKIVYRGITSERIIYTDRLQSGIYIIKVGRTIQRINVSH